MKKHNKNQQLDLLLLKAESYSHFIEQNQKRAREAWEKSQAVATPVANVSTKKRTSSIVINQRRTQN